MYLKRDLPYFKRELMKTFYVLTFFACSMTFAADVKISSFQYLGQSKLAELCGSIEGISKSGEFVEIVSDPKLKVPGIYVVPVSKSGKFCHVIRSISGLADVTHDAQTVEAFSK